MRSTDGNENITVVKTESLDGHVELTTLDILSTTTEEADSTTSVDMTTEEHVQPNPYSRWRNDLKGVVKSHRAHSPEAAQINKSATQKGSPKSVNGSSTDASDSSAINAMNDVGKVAMTGGNDGSQSKRYWRGK